MNDSYNYKSMSREKLIEHLKAASKALHEMKNHCQILTLRLNLIEKQREVIHGKRVAA